MKWSVTGKVIRNRQTCPLHLRSWVFSVTTCELNVRRNGGHWYRGLDSAQTDRTMQLTTNRNDVDVDLVRPVNLWTESQSIGGSKGGRHYFCRVSTRSFVNASILWGMTATGYCWSDLLRHHSEDPYCWWNDPSWRHVISVGEVEFSGRKSFVCCNCGGELRRWQNLIRGDRAQNYFLIQWR